jgi:hypothetical protein
VLCFFAWREKRRSNDERKEMLAAATAILAMTGADSTTFQPSPAMYPGFQPPVVRPSNV